MMGQGHSHLFANCFHDKFVVQFYLEDAAPVSANLYDLAGKLVSSQDLGSRTEGVNLANVDGSKLPAGNYEGVAAHTIELTSNYKLCY